MNKRAYHIHWYNSEFAKTGVVLKVTTSEERAVELFYREYSEDYKILYIHD